MRASRRRKRYQISMSLGTTILLGVALFFLLAWIFVLGVLVGRGFLPEGVQNLAELKRQLAGLQGLSRNERSAELEKLKELEKVPEFQFHKTLGREGGPSPEKPRPRVQPKTGASPSRPPRGYTVQLASLENGLQALKMVSRLVDRGYPAYFYAYTANGKAHFRVRCGPFKTEAEAREMASRLARLEKLSGFVTRYEQR